MASVFIKQFLLPYIKNELINKSFDEIKELINNQLSDLITDVIIKGKGNLADFEKKVTNIFNKIDEIGTLTEEEEPKILDDVRKNIKNKNKDSEKNNYIVIDYFLLQLLPRLKGLIQPDTNPKLNLEGNIYELIKVILKYAFKYSDIKDDNDCINSISKLFINDKKIHFLSKCNIIKIKSVLEELKELPKKISDRITDFISEIKNIVISGDDAKFNEFIQKNKILFMALDIKNTKMYNAIKVIVNNINNKNIDSITLPDNINKYEKQIKLVLNKINEPNVTEKTLQPELPTLINKITEPYFNEIKTIIDEKIKNKYYLDNEDIYYEKYIKYKSKYLELKYQNENK